MADGINLPMSFVTSAMACMHITVLASSSISWDIDR